MHKTHKKIPVVTTIERTNQNGYICTYYKIMFFVTFVPFCGNELPYLG